MKDYDELLEENSDLDFKMVDLKDKLEHAQNEILKLKAKLYDKENEITNLKNKISEKLV